MAAQSPPDVRVTLLGVDLHWRNPGLGYRDPIHRGLAEVHRAVLEHALPAIRRQKRQALYFWDAMTAILGGELRPKSRGRQAYELLAEATCAVADGPLAPALILEVAGSAQLSGVRSQIRAHKGRPKGSRSLDRVVYDIRGRAQSQGPGLYRHFELDMGDLNGQIESIDWLQALYLAVLVQLRAEFEVYVETSTLPIRCCERHACRAFFRMKRMAGRQRFCSDTCRASAPREQ